MKDFNDFIKSLCGFYNVGNDYHKNKRISRIRSYMIDKEFDQEYDLEKAYFEITSFNSFGNVPILDDIKAILFSCKITKLKYKNDVKNGIIHGSTGIFICNGCLGQGGKLIKEKKDGIEYEFFHNCKYCYGEGISEGDNTFKFFEGKGIMNDEIQNLIERTNNEIRQRKKEIATRNNLNEVDTKNEEEKNMLF